jgi:hypothetical protein
MAQLALPPGAARRRALFGLLDADGWGWAAVKATFWFLMLLFLIGYIPNLAYYFTVSDTVDVGYNAVPIVNFCDAGNDRPDRKIPCPAPPGSVIPWDQSPMDLPDGRAGAQAIQSGSHLYLVGGRTASGATQSVLATTVDPDGNLGAWSDGPSLPAPRTGAALAVLSGVPYVIGGLDASGTPTDTVFVGQVAEGALTGWAIADGSVSGVPNLSLPTPISDAAAVATADGIFLIGGRSAEGPVGTVLQTELDTSSPPSLGTWKELTGLALPEARAGATAVLDGNFLYVAGGTGPAGATSSVDRLGLVDNEPASGTNGNPAPWVASTQGQPDELPAARTLAAGFTANGALYVIGGSDASGTPQVSLFWTVPDELTGAISAWSHTDATDLLEGRSASALASVGSKVFLIGGDGQGGPAAGTYAASLSPQPPFFRLGLFGATIPALSIKGEIGQQLGYLDAMGVGMVNFGILVLIGLAYSHPRQTLHLIERLSRGRFRAPAEDDEALPQE